MGRVEIAGGTTGGGAGVAMRPEEVKAIRYRLKQSQAEFALMLGVSLSTLQGWEEGKHRPDGPAMALLRVAAKNPKIVAKTLGRS